MNREKYYWATKYTRKFLSKGYLDPGVTLEERVRQIAERAEEILGIKGFADKFEEYVALGYYTLATPVLINFGNDKGFPVSCFGTYIPDDTAGILRASAEVGMMSKMGGGTSAYFGDVRHRGSLIKGGRGGETDGPVRFMELFDKTADVISQGASRRGSFVGYLPVEHPDVDEFLNIRSEGNPIQNMSFGVTITREWMREMKDGDKKKRAIWGKILKTRFKTGYPYLFFTDNVNDAAPQVYKDKGLKVKASNLCVSGDQRVPTQHGILTAKELYHMNRAYEESLTLFDNKKFVNATGMKLIEKNADVYKVTLENGMEHTITGYHKLVKLIGRSQPKGKSQKIITENVELKDLKIGDSIAIQTNKGIFGKHSALEEAFLLGLYQGDGTQTAKEVFIDIWENDFDLIDEIQNSHKFLTDKYSWVGSTEFRDCTVSNGNVKKKRLRSTFLKQSDLKFEKGYVPDWIWTGNEETIWQYIRGLFYADGTVTVGNSSGNPLQLSLASINKDFLKEIQILLANLGIQTSIRILRKGGKTLLPNGKGGHSEYPTKDCWRLIIGNKNDALIFDENTGFLKRKGIHLENRKYRNNTKKFYKISSIDYEGKEDVYCTTVDSDEHLWVCNGFITHNCSEICLSSDEENSFVCVLSSLNLVHWDEIKENDAIETLIYFLDAVNEEFIQKAEGVPFLDKAVHFAKTQRALGAGVFGWHHLLQSKSIPFESMEAKLLNIEIFKTFRERADKATEELVKLFGEPELLKGYGRRNVTTMSEPPTTSSAAILNFTSQSIEPETAVYYIKRLAKGTFEVKNKYFEQLLIEKGKNDQDVWNSILANGGSVQHLDFLTDHEKEVFKTACEISQKEVVIQQIQRQKYIDQSTSLNLYIPHNAKPKDVSDLLIFAEENGIKTIYYQISTSPTQGVVRNILGCTSCEG